GEQLFGIGAVAEWGSLETEEGFHHRPLLLRILGLIEQFYEIDAGRFRPRSCHWFRRRQLSIDDRIDGPRHALQVSLEMDLDLSAVQRIEAYLDRLAGELGRRFMETEERRVGECTSVNELIIY